MSSRTSCSNANATPRLDYSRYIGQVGDGAGGAGECIVECTHAGMITEQQQADLPGPAGQLVRMLYLETAQTLRLNARPAAVLIICHVFFAGD